MRTINVTTDVYAAIWAAREPGEESEDVILKRVLNVPTATVQRKGQARNGEGFSDARFDLVLPEGFEIFRNYKGTEFRARATGGKWLLLQDGKLYPSLNQLSRATSGNIENAWRNWYFVAQDGKRYLIERLRNDVQPNVRHLL
jgi:hypothetical protein